MGVLLYALMSLFIVVAGFILIGVTLYQWRQQSKIEKSQAGSSQKLEKQSDLVLTK